MSTPLPPQSSSTASSSTASSPQYVPSVPSVPAAPPISADVLTFPQPTADFRPPDATQPEATQPDATQPAAFSTDTAQPQPAFDAPPRRPFNLPGYFPFRLPATRGGRIALALCVVYLVWGSTYMAVHLSLESFPPLMLSGLRNLFAGIG